MAVTNTNEFSFYDGDGRICAVINQLSGTATGYQYDAEGIRVAKGTLSSTSCSSGNGFTTTAQYLVGLGGQQVTELDGGGNQKHFNVWVGGSLLATYDPKGLHYAFSDILGTKRVQASGTGVVEETCQSLPFGDGLNCAQTAVATADDATEHHFTKKERDTESGLDYFEARYYGSLLGRFMSPDWSSSTVPVPYADLNNPQSLNLYAYVQNNPVTHDDLTGHAPQVGECYIGTGNTRDCGATYGGQVSNKAAKAKKANHEDSVRKQQDASSAVALAQKQAQKQNSAAVNTVYNETGGLRPYASADPNSAQNLQTARENVAHVYKNTKGKGFESSKKLSGRERSALRHNEPDAVNGYASSKDAVSAAYRSRTDPTGGATHIYLYDLSPNSTQRVPAWVRNGNPTTAQGPFINAAGGGDVRAGSLVLILTIKDQR